MIAKRYASTVISVTGAPGTGKTYSRAARFIYDWWLPQETGVHWSNFPLNVEVFAAKFPDAADRIQIIPADELRAWSDFESGRGPWSFFAEKDLQGAHISIDEIHNFLKKTGKGCEKNADRWQQWLGEIRHRGCTVEFLSQDPQKVHKCVEMHSAVRIQLINSEDRRDPLFGIPLGDWYELRAVFTREYETVIWQIEERRILGKWVPGGVERFTLNPEYFKLYDSFNAPHTGGKKASGQLREYQKRSAVGVVFWFLYRNVFRLLSRFAAAAVLVWLCFFGGATLCINYFIEHVKARSAAEKVEKEKEKEPEKNPLEEKKPVESVKPAPAPAVKPVPVSSIPPSAVLPAAPVAVRSETLAHHSLERAPDAREQQAALPRLVLLSVDWVSLDDGQLVAVGEAVGEWKLESIDFARRRAAFTCPGQPVLVVPVGGPVGVRGAAQKRSPGAEGSGLFGLVPKIEPAEPAE